MLQVKMFLQSLLAMCIIRVNSGGVVSMMDLNIHVLGVLKHMKGFSNPVSS